MLESRKKKETCLYEKDSYKCNRTLYDKYTCIFHSGDISGKKDRFMTAFLKEYELQKKKGKVIFKVLFFR